MGRQERQENKQNEDREPDGIAQGDLMTVRARESFIKVESRT
jgi:hypothetical protein